MTRMNAARALLFSLLSAACSPAPQAEAPADPGATAAASAMASEAPPHAASTAPAESAAASASGASGAALPLEVQEHTLDAKVKAVLPMAENANRSDVRLVDADPRFVVQLELLGVAPAMADDPKGSALVAGTTVWFGVHSPARLFKTDADMTGKRMHFGVTRTRTKTGVSFGALHAE